MPAHLSALVAIVEEEKKKKLNECSSERSSSGWKRFIGKVDST